MPEHAGSPARRKVTDTIEVIDGTEMHVAFAGDRCALHIFTRSGIRRIVLPLHVFIERARAARDGNGHPFPATCTRTRAAIERELEEDAAAMPPEPPAFSEPGIRIAAPAETDGMRPLTAKHGRPGEHSHNCERAWDSIVADPIQTVARAAARFNITRSTFQNWINNHRAGRLTALRQAAGIRMRGVRRANHIEAAAQGLPLLKPNGGL